MNEERRGVLSDPLLPVYAFVLAATWLPANLVLLPLGGIGAPATIFGVLTFVWYLLTLLRPGALASGFNPARLAVLVFALAMLLGYGTGLAKPLSPLEAGGSGRALIIYVGYVGLGLYVVDAVRDRRHLDRLLNVIVVGVSGMALMGMLQFITDVGPTSYIQVPGLTLLESDIDASRSLFTRVQATAAHPIEFGVVLAVILPVALHLAIQGSGGRPPSRWRWVPVVLLLVATPMTVSRSSVLGIAVGAGILAVSWSARFRLNAAVGALVLLVAMRAAFPGLLGTLRSMFVFFGDDPSISGRTDDYPQVVEFVTADPWLGRGLGSFVPEQHFFLDNEYLGILITTGVVGLVSILVLFVVTIGTGRGVYHHAQDPVARSLGQALAASAAVTAFTWITYDGLAFRMHAGLAFILMGAVGALWRLEVGHLRWGVGVDRTRPALPRDVAPPVEPAAERPRPRPGVPVVRPAAAAAASPARTTDLP